VKTISKIIGVFFVLGGGVVSSAHATDFAFITTTDFVTGSSSVIWLDSAHTHTNNVRAVYSDAVCRYFGGFVYVVNRYGADNIQILDPANGFSTVRQFSVGSGSDPHDILVINPTKAYVTRYNTNDLWIVNPATGVKTGSISLAGLADADGVAEMDQMARVGNRVFVTVQRIDRNNYYQPVGDSYVAVIDITTDSLVDVDPVAPGVQSIALTATDPFSDIQLDPYSGKLYVACVGSFGLNDGCVELVDPVALLSDGCLVSEAGCGGDITDVEIVSPDKGYAIVVDASFNTVLTRFDVHTGRCTGVVFSPGGYVLNDVECSPYGEVFLADRTPTNPGIRIFDIVTDNQTTTNPIDVGLPPFDICFSVSVQTGVGGGAPPPAEIGLGTAHPNPFNPTTAIPFTLPERGPVRLEIYDVRGRRVRHLVDQELPAGPHVAIWDGKNDAYTSLPSGVYFAKLRARGGMWQGKLVLVK
jgi:hypothetical protein